jgi:beta-glucosidase
VRGRWLVAVAALFVVAPAAAAEAAGRCGEHPWCKTSLSPDRRAELLLGALTRAERISLLAGDEAGGVLGRAGTHTGTGLGVPRLDLPPLYLTDGPIGVRQGPSTALPSSIALAASFNRRLAQRDGALVGNEAKLKGNDVVLAPTINLLRTPLWGRAFESLGEDPFLTARLGVAWIRGAQAQGVIANVKHFALNNQEGERLPDGSLVGSRLTVDARVDERTMVELYLSQFEAAVKDGRAGSVMCSYNRLNGPHACESKQLLDQVLRRRWGFRGFVLADYTASKRVGSGLRAGLDFEPFPFFDSDGGENYTPAAVQAALAAGRTSQALVDRAVRRLLRTLFVYGFFDRAAYVDDDSRVDRTAHAEEARRLAEAGTVLLKNDGALPLAASRLKSLAVIGADGDAYKNGGGSSNIVPYSLVTPRQGIATRAGAGVDVRYDPGDDLERAANVARSANAAVVVVADSAGEGEDKPCLGLDCGAPATLQRDRLIERVATANDHTIVVLETAGPVLTPWRAQVEAIVEAWYPGSGGGAAIARVLFGDVDPGGRLPATFPRRERDGPTAGNRRRYPGVGDAVHYSEGVLAGYRWFDQRGVEPAFPFGHGLSYTRFAFRGLRVRRAGRGVDARVSVEVVNTGRRAGIAVPQLYLGLPRGRGRMQPPRQLKGFESVNLRPGRGVRVSFALDERAFSYWNSRHQRWQVAPGCYHVLLGRSSRDIVARATIPLRGGHCPG